MMRPLDPTEWLHAKRIEALAAGDHAGFDHATALLDELTGSFDAYEMNEQVRSVLLDAGVIRPNEWPDASTVQTLLRMFLPAVPE